MTYILRLAALSAVIACLLVVMTRKQETVTLVRCVAPQQIETVNMGVRL